LFREALESLFALTFTDYEVIVVDDGSTDDTDRVVAGFGSRLRPLKQANRGPGAARNFGASQAKGEYLAFLDSDDVLFPWSLQKYAEIIAACGKPAFIAGKPFRFGHVIELTTACDERQSAESFGDYYASGDQWRWWGASSFVVRRDAFQAVGGFTDEWINGEDADLAMRLGVSSGFVQITAPHTFGYREHAASAMKDTRRTLAGAWHQVRAEQQARYPGGPDRARERWQILTRHIRPVALDCLRLGLRQDAWGLYRSMFRWHLALGRWKYLAGFPMKSLASSPGGPLTGS
jgi:glycosyltransferase involved in cell wall biosynthesis